MKILVVDDETELRLTLCDVLTDAGHEVGQAADGIEAAALLRAEGFDLVVSDVRLPGLDGLALMRAVRRESPLTEFILMTAFAEIGEAVGALKRGASDYLVKPFQLDELLHHVSRFDKTRSLRRELAEARRALATRTTSARLVGQSPQLMSIRTRVEMFSASEAPTLITGESGTGKEIVARLLHECGPRATKPFVAVNCAAFPDTLIEAELFGYAQGAFTGAVKTRDGRFRAADHGTLFLDEVAELSPPAQAKLLRVLQEGVVEPLGTDQPVKVDVRVVTATHRNLRDQVAKGAFREDLLYRIDVLNFALPPLRDREGDLAILIDHFLGELARTDASGKRQSPAMSPEAYAALARYPFPGNVRELAHAVEHAIVLSGGGEILLEHLPANIAGYTPDASAEADAVESTSFTAPLALVPPGPLGPAVRAFEKTHLRRALHLAGGKRMKAAEMLGISRKSLWEKLRAYALEEELPKARAN